MKIAYCILYTGNNFEEISENIDQFVDAGDDVYVMVNDDTCRDDLFLSYVDEPRVDISQHQQVALPADLSLPRGWIVQMKDAFDFEVQQDGETHYDYFITLSDGMLPIVSKEKMDEFLTSLNGKDCFYEVANTDTDEDLKKRVEDYAFFTNSFDFQKSKVIRGMNSFTAKLVHNFKQREINDTVYLTYPWFILSRDTAEAIVDNMEYCSNSFLMCQYPEELAIGTMVHKYSNNEHVNKDFVVCGETGNYEFMKPIKEIKYEDVFKKEGALFATKIHVDDLYTYMETFDTYMPLKDFDLYDTED